jgi:hypothetical protein
VPPPPTAVAAAAAAVGLQELKLAGNRCARLLCFEPAERSKRGCCCLKDALDGLLTPHPPLPRTPSPRCPPQCCAGRRSAPGPAGLPDQALAHQARHLWLPAHHISRPHPASLGEASCAGCVVVAGCLAGTLGALMTPAASHVCMLRRCVCVVCRACCRTCVRRAAAA